MGERLTSAQRVGESGSVVPFVSNSLSLFFGWDFTSDEKPEKGLRKGFTTFLGSGEKLLALGDSLSTESNSFLGVQNGSFPDHGLDSSHTSIGHIDGDVSQL